MKPPPLVYIYCLVVCTIAADILLSHESMHGDLTNWYNINRHRKPHSQLPAVTDRHTLYAPQPQQHLSKSLFGSYGFLNITDADWDLKRAIHWRQSAKQRGGHFLSSRDYFTENWEPTMACDFEERIGRQGDGGKWVCNPQGLKTRCNVISIGSDNDFSFEEALHALNPACNIHTFDHTIEPKAPAFVHFHPFGIGDTQAGRLLTMDGIIQAAGLENQEIDILKIDCEGCEIDVFADMMGHPIRQILMEVHGWGSVSQYDMDDLFETMGRNKYVIFHKEPNLYTKGECVEYGFVNVDYA
jgi:hypothetical protein